MDSSITQRVAAEVRGELARQNMKGADLARALGKDAMWASRRLRGVKPFDVEELDEIARLLGIPITRLVEQAVRAA